MNIVRKVIVLLLFIILVLLLAILVRIYLDIRDAKAYVNFVTESTNDLIIRVEKVNKLLNEFDSENLNQIENTLSTEKQEIDASYNDIMQKRNQDTSIPYKGEEVDSAFGSYLEEVNNLTEALDEVIVTIQNNEDTDIFENKLEAYVTVSNDLQIKADDLEGKLNTFVDIYNSIDFERVKDAVTSL